MIDAYAFLAVFVYPLWLAAGVADWACHRVARIEGSTGTPENALHLVQTALVGAPIAAVLAFDVNRGVLAVVAACVVAHTFAAAWDIAYARSRRDIGTFEQIVHGFLVVLPMLAAALLVAVHHADADWLPRLRDPALPSSVVLAVLASGFVCAVLPMLEEHLRCRRAEAAT